MIRKLLAAVAALAASACVSTGSTFDVAPKEARYSRAPVPSGQWCPVDGSKPEDFVVESRSEACFRMQWKGGRRTYAVDAKDPESTDSVKFEIGFSALGDGLMLGQLETRTIEMSPMEDAKDFKEEMPPYMHVVYLASGEALAMVPFSVTAEEFDALALRHPALKLDGKSTNRTVTAGTREQVLAYLRELTRMSLDEEPTGVSFMVRDRGGSADHKPSDKQAADLANIIAAYKALPR